MVPTVGMAAPFNPNDDLIPPEYVEPDPRLYISSNKTFTGEVGDSFRIPVTIKNEGDGYAKNISVRAGFSGNGEVYIDGPGYDNIRDLSPNRSKNVSFDVKIDKAAPNGTYTLTIQVDYENYNGSKVQSSTETLNVRVSTKATSTALTITRVDIMPSNTINPGDNLVAGFEITNKGDAPARDVKVSLNGLSNEGFALSSGLNNKTVQSIEPGKKTYLYFELKSSKKLSAGSQELEMVLNYKDSKGEPVEEINKFYIEVRSNADQSSSLIMEKLTYPTGTLGQNKEVDVNFVLRNQGQMDAKNVMVTAESQDQGGLVAKTVSIIKVPAIAPGESKELNFKFLTSKGGDTKNYPITISVEYMDEVGDYDFTQYIGVFVVAPPEPGTGKDPIKSTPRLIIDRYDFIPQLVPAGENFSMNLSFFNTNGSKTVKNIKIFLTSDETTDPNSNSGGGSVFTPVDSSNTFYIDSIPPKGRVEKTITMYTVPDAQAKTYTLTANFEYEDNTGEAYTATELIGIPVIQQSKLETGELGVYPEAYIGEPAPVSLEFYNTGKVTLYNMMVKIEGDFQTENGSYYIGNFVSGSSEYFEGMVIPMEPGELTGDVVFTYEDSTGEEQELRKPFTLNVMEAPPMDDWNEDDFPPMEEEGGMFSKLIKSPWLWAAIIILAGGIGFGVYRKKKKEKEFDLDE